MALITFYRILFFQHCKIYQPVKYVKRNNATQPVQRIAKWIKKITRPLAFLISGSKDYRKEQHKTIFILSLINLSLNSSMVLAKILINFNGKIKLGAGVYVWKNAVNLFVMVIIQELLQVASLKCLNILTYANNIKMKPLWGIRSWVYRVSLKFTHNYFKKENQNEKGSSTLKRISRYHFWFSPRIHVESITPYKAQMIILWLLVVLIAVLHIRTLRTYPISGINRTTKLIDSFQIKCFKSDLSKWYLLIYSKSKVVFQVSDISIKIKYKSKAGWWWLLADDLVCKEVKDTNQVEGSK